MAVRMYELWIESVVGREILDSRGNPTVEAEVFSLLRPSVGGRVRPPAALPPGSLKLWSCGMEINPVTAEKGSPRRWKTSIPSFAKSSLEWMLPTSMGWTKAMIQADGTQDKSKLGANAILAVSHCLRPSCGCGVGDSVVPLSGRGQRQPSAGAHDEHP